MTYKSRFTIAQVVVVVGVIAGILSGTVITPFHPSWLTTDIAATAGIISAICVALASRLPDTSLSPSHREAKYLKAATLGELPADIAAKYPEGKPPPPVV